MGERFNQLTWCWFSDLVESMRQAELCDWALDPALFTSLCDSLNRFFTQKGLIGSPSGSPSTLAPPPLALPPSTPPTLASLTNPSPLAYPSISGPGSQGTRRSLIPQIPMQPFQRQGLPQPATNQHMPPKGTTFSVPNTVTIVCLLQVEYRGVYKTEG